MTNAGQEAELARRIAEDVLPYMERIGACGESYTADYEIALMVIRDAAAALFRARAEALEEAVKAVCVCWPAEFTLEEVCAAIRALKDRP